MQLTPLYAECRSQGFQAGLRHALHKSGHVKSALNPRMVGKINVDPARREMLAAIGKDVFRKIRDPQVGYGQTFLKMLLPGFDRIPAGVTLDRAMQQEMSGLSKSLRGAYKFDAGHNLTNRLDPTVVGMRDNLKRRAAAWKQLKDQNFAEIGTVAEPRINFARKAIPAAGGLAAGGLAAGAGAGYLGHQEGRYGMAEDMAQAPLFQRLKYLLAPTTAASELYRPPQRQSRY